MQHTTLVVGASTNPERYAYKAIQSLRDHGHDVIAYGRRPGEVSDVSIMTDWANITTEVDTVTLYVGSKHQDEAFIESILALKPRRIIFNPGTEHPSFFMRAKADGIQPLNACTLVLLSTHQY